ncbi:MAG: FliM/FliN family flagellar motor switch protein [Mariprofundaceae bacterium]
MTDDSETVVVGEKQFQDEEPDTDVVSLQSESEPVLEAAEIEALMATMAPDETVEAMFATLPPLKQPENVEPFSFELGGEAEGPGRYPLFVNLQERMTESLKGQWSDMFARDVGIVFQNMDQNSYREIISSEDPRVFFAYEVEGYGRMMLAFELPLIVAYVDAMLGGDGETYGEEILKLSPVEKRLSQRIAKSLEMHLEEAWKPVTYLDFELFKLETDPQFLSVAGAQDNCFSMYFDITLGEKGVTGGFALHYPRSFLEPMLDNLRSTMSDDPVAVDEEWAGELESALNTVPITLRLELGQCSMNVGKFLSISTGDYLPLRVSESEPAVLWVDKMPMFKAQAGSQDGMLAAELIEAIQDGGHHE